MSRIREIAPEMAEGMLREIYEMVRGSRGKVANIMKVHSLDPEALRRHIDLYLHLMFTRSGLTRRQREMVAVAVSHANRCDYCVSHHSESLQALWRDTDACAAFVKDPVGAALDAKERAMIRYAIDLTTAPHAVEDDSVEALRVAGWSDEEILRLTLVVAYFNFVNRIALGLGVPFSAEEVRGYTNRPEIDDDSKRREGGGT